MQIISGSHNFDATLKPCAIAIGNFDGVHLAHRQLIEKAISIAKNNKLTSAVLTFNPHPAGVLSSTSGITLIQTLDQRLEQIGNLGIDVAIIEEFSVNLAKLSPMDFVERIIADNLGAKYIIVGYDFTFGYKRSADVEILKTLCNKFKIHVDVVSPIFLDDTLISSTNIRRALFSGHIEVASRLLGRPYVIEGKVVKGRGVGKKRLVPTANIEPINELIPRDGIYATRTILINKTITSVTSIGNNPTFPDSSFAVEVHNIDWSGDLIGQTIQIEFLSRLRSQKTFASIEDLKKQILEDIEEAKTVNSPPPPA